MLTLDYLLLKCSVSTYSSYWLLQFYARREYDCEDILVFEFRPWRAMRHHRATSCMDAVT
jgi:hypothetical protein